MNTITKTNSIPKKMGVERILPGKLYAEYAPATYRTKDGFAFYRFRYVKISGHFEIDILKQPSYGGRSTGCHITHRLSSSRGGKKICISRGREPKTIEKAKKISVEWAELTHKYIQTGKTIDRQVQEITASNRSASNGTSSTENQNNSTPSFLRWLFN